MNEIQLTLPHLSIIRLETDPDMLGTTYRITFNTGEQVRAFISKFELANPSGIDLNKLLIFRVERAYCERYRPDMALPEQNYHEIGTRLAEGDWRALDSVLQSRLVYMTHEAAVKQVAADFNLYAGFFHGEMCENMITAVQRWQWAQESAISQD